MKKAFLMVVTTLLYTNIASAECMTPRQVWQELAQIAFENSRGTVTKINANDSAALYIGTPLPAMWRHLNEHGQFRRCGLKISVGYLHHVRTMQDLANLIYWTLRQPKLQTLQQNYGGQVSCLYKNTSSGKYFVAEHNDCANACYLAMKNCEKGSSKSAYCQKQECSG